MRLLENYLIMVSSCWGYILWYWLVQLPLMLWRPFSWQSSKGTISMFSCRALGNAWSQKAPKCEMCLAWGTESLSGGAEGRGVQVVYRENEKAVEWVFTENWQRQQHDPYKAAKEKQCEVMIKQAVEVHSQDGESWKFMSSSSFRTLLHLQIWNLRRLLKVGGESLRIVGHNAHVLNC